MTLKYKVENQILRAVGCMRRVVELSRNVVYLELEFDAEWDGAAITVLFSNDFVENGKTYQKIWNNEPIPVPTEVLETGMLRIGCVGLLDGGKTRITTARMERGVQILRCGGIIGVDPAGETPELWEQLLASMGQLGDLQTKDKSSLVAAINEVLSQVGTGSGSVDPADIAKAVEDYLSANPIQEQDPTVPAWAKQPEKPTYTAAEVGALPDTYKPPVDDALSETSANPVQNKVVAGKLSEIEAIAKGRVTGYVFDTESDMRAWIASNASELNIGDNLYIRATNVPDYWWDGTAAQPLETQKIDLTEYAKKSEVPAVDATLTQPGQAADAAEVGSRLSSLSEEIVITSESKVSAHNTGADTHGDIRLLIQGLTDRLNALADSDDTTLDQLSEVVAYIKSNRTLIEAITTSKVSVADIIDNLTTNVTNKPLSAAQGVALKALIDAISVPDKLPNPNALTFTGAVTGSYDGSAPLEVEIPSGGGAAGDYIQIPSSAEVGQTIVVKAVDENGKPTEWEASDFPSGDTSKTTFDYEKTIVLEEDAASITIDTFDDGTPLALKKVEVVLVGSNATSANQIVSITPDYRFAKNGGIIDLGGGNYYTANKWSYLWGTAEINDGEISAEFAMQNSQTIYTNYYAGIASVTSKVKPAVTFNNGNKDIFPIKATKFISILAKVPTGSFVAGTILRIRGVKA